MMPDTLNVNIVSRLALEGNGKLEAMRLMEKSEYQKIGPLSAWDDPMLMLGIQNLPTSFKFGEEAMTMKMIGISQNIPYAGEKGFSRKAALAKAMASGYDTRESELEIVTQAGNLYMTLYYRQKALELMQAQRELQQDIVSSTAAKLISNQATQADLSAVQADLWRLDSDILSAEQEVDEAYDKLCGITGTINSSHIPYLQKPDMGTPVSVDNWLDNAKTNYPPLKRAQNLSESYHYSAAAAKRMRWPMLGFSASYGIRSGSSTDPMTGEIMKWDNMVSFQANISLPIFAGRQQRNMALSMSSMSRSYESENAQIWRDTEAELRSLYHQYQNLARSLALYTKHILPADEDAYNSALAGFSSNRTSLSNLISVALDTYRDRLSANQLEYQLSQTIVMANRYTINIDGLK